MRVRVRLTFGAIGVVPESFSSIFCANFLQIRNVYATARGHAKSRKEVVVQPGPPNLPPPSKNESFSRMLDLKVLSFQPIFLLTNHQGKVIYDSHV